MPPLNLRVPRKLPPNPRFPPLLRLKPQILQPLSPGLPALVDVATELRCPWLGLYGDQYDDEVLKLREAANRSESASDVLLFPAADHRFDIHPDGAVEAWSRMLNWFDAHLR